MKKLVREAMVDALIAEGVDHFFGLLGGQSVHAITEHIFDHQSDVKMIPCRDERSASFMACGYTQMSQRPSVAHATLGPGFGNLIPGMYEAYRSSWPVIFMSPCAPTPSFGYSGMQEVPQIDMVRPLMKWAFKLDMPDKAEWMIRRALSEACSGVPGPVYLEIPTEMGAAEANCADVYQTAVRATAFEPSDDAVEAALDMLLAAKKPLIIAGHGVHMARAHAELQELAELLGITVATTHQGKAAIPEDHPLAIGVHGHVGTQWTNEFADTSDCVFWVASGMEDLATHVYTRGRGRGKLLALNVNPSHMTRVWRPDCALVGDAKLGLAKLIKHAKARGSYKPFMELPRVKQLLEEKKRWDAELAEEQAGWTGKDPMEVGRVCQELSRVIPDNAVLVPDSGFNSFFAQSYPHLKLKKAGNQLMHSEYYHIGFAAPAAMGASLATTDPVVAVVGDGGFHYTMMELTTAVEQKMPVMIVVMDNQAIGWIKYWQKVMCDGRYCGTDFEVGFDFAKMAESAGMSAVTVGHESELEAGFAKAFEIQASGKPVLVHAKVTWDTDHWGSNYCTDTYKAGKVCQLKEKVEA